MRKFALYLLSLFSAVLTSAVGLFFAQELLSNTILFVFLCILALLPTVLLIYNILSTKKFISVINQTKVADGNAFLIKHRENAEKTAKIKLKELQKIRRLCSVYTVFLSILAIDIAVIGGALMGISPALYAIGILYSGLMFLSVYTRIHGKQKLVLNPNAPSIEKEAYPLIYSLAAKAAERIGCITEIQIVLTWDCSASITRDSKKVYLQIGVILLNTLSDEELYAIFLHEFAHISNNNRESFRESQYNAWICEGGGSVDGLSAFLSNIYLKSATKYMFNYAIYQYASSVVEELRADKAMYEYGNAAIATSALLKTHYDTMFFWESCVKNEPSIFESEELKADYLSNKTTALKKAIAERSAFWNDLILKEILANNATHPTLKMRMEAMGIDKPALADSKSSDEYIAEIQKALQFAEKLIYDDRSKTYENDRKEQYLEPLERIEEWHRAGSPICAETYADLVSDLKTLGKHEEAEALCDSVLQQLPTMSSAHAAFIKGACMLYRYDESGMELIYRAMEQNGNYIQEGLSVIGEFCCLTGRAEALEDYRKRAAILAQKHKDCDSQISYLSKSDNLTKENLPDGMLDEILAYIKSIDQDIIQNIYLVRKTVNEDFFASVFIIHFFGGSNAQQDEIMHKIFRFLDSHPVEWQFALFDYFEYPEVKVEKIEGSLVYTKE